jgi:hypothetical protein
MVANLKLPKDQNPPNIFFFGKFVSGKIVKIFLPAQGHIIVSIIFVVAIPSTATITTKQMNVKRKIFSLLISVTSRTNHSS